MRTPVRCLAGAAAAGLVLAVAAQAGAETATLQLKRLEVIGAPGVVHSRSSLDYVYRMTYPQHFYMSIREDGRKVIGGDAAAFARAVKKEPAKYQSEHPFRGAAKLGGKDYGFVLDAQDAKSGGYGRLYFDFNHNGDLTDDKPVDALPARGTARGSSSYRFSSFPRVDVTLTLDGEKLDYSFFLTAYSMVTAKTGYASASLNAAAYREGDISLGGKTRHVVLLDYNSNGCFNDEFTVRGNVQTLGGVVYPEKGDILVIDPDPAVSGRFYAYDVIGDPSRHLVSKLAGIDGRFYTLKLSPTGEKLSLEPSSLPLGHLTSAYDGFRAVVYGKQGFLKIAGGKNWPIAVPAGQWKLVSYTIDRTGYKEPAAKPAEGKTPKVEKKRSLLQAIAESLTGKSTSTAVSRVSSSVPRQTLVSARATGDCKPVEVAEGKTVALPFGPPYKPVVKAAGRGAEKVSLNLSLVGAAGEQCSDLRVDGQRPGKPEFVIRTPDGKEVQRGSFEYG